MCFNVNTRSAARFFEEQFFFSNENRPSWVCLLPSEIGTNDNSIIEKETLKIAYLFSSSFKKMHLKMLPGKWRPFCFGLNVLTSNGSWCIGIKGEMSGTVCVTFTWDIYIYIYIWVVYSFCLFCCLFIIVTWWYIWCIVWQVASKRKYRHFGNRMAIYYIMPRFIQNHSRFVMLMKTCMIS